MFDRVKTVKWPPLNKKKDRGLNDRIQADPRARQAIVAELVAYATALFNSETNTPEPPKEPASVIERTEGWREDEFSTIQSWAKEHLRKAEGVNLGMAEAFEAFQGSLSAVEKTDRKGNDRYSLRYFANRFAISVLGSKERTCTREAARIKRKLLNARNWFREPKEPTSSKFFHVCARTIGSLRRLVPSVPL